MIKRRSLTQVKKDNEEYLFKFDRNHDLFYCIFYDPKNRKKIIDRDLIDEVTIFQGDITKN